MDGDPAVEPELDGFSRVLPLPYRVALIIVLGMPPRLGSNLLAMQNTVTLPLVVLTNMRSQASGRGASTFTTSP